MTTVLHHSGVWLPATCTWLYTQVRFLPESITNHVLCEQVANLDRFPIDNLHPVRQHRLRFAWDRLLRKAGLRTHSGVGVHVARRIRADVVHSHFGQMGWADRELARRASLKHVVTFYGADVHQAARKDPRWHDRYADLFASVDRVLCEGPFMAQSLVDQGCPQDKVTVHPLGVDLTQFPYRFRPWEPSEPLRVLVAGTFREKKGIPDAVNALCRLHEATGINLVLDLVGDATAKPGDAVEKRAIEVALSEARFTVHRHGFVDHATLNRLVDGCHLMLSPSVTAADGDCEGGAPVTLIEAAAMGVPIVSTRHCDIPNVVLDGQSGWLADERNVDELTECLVQAVSAPQTWETRSKVGRAHVETTFDAVKQGQALAAVYASL